MTGFTHSPDTADNISRQRPYQASSVVEGLVKVECSKNATRKSRRLVETEGTKGGKNMTKN